MGYDPSREYVSLTNGTFEGATVDDGFTVDPEGWNILEPQDHYVRYEFAPGPDSSRNYHALLMRDIKDLAGLSYASQRVADPIQSDWETITFEFDVMESAYPLD